MQIYLLHFNKNSSTAVPSRNTQSPLEQIVRSEDKKDTKNFWDVQIVRKFGSIIQRSEAYYSKLFKVGSNTSQFEKIMINYG